MSDLLIPLGLLVFIALFAGAMVSAGRQQRARRRSAFRKFARRHGLEYLAVDDGSAQRFAGDLDGIGRFESASLGSVA